MSSTRTGKEPAAERDRSGRFTPGNKANPDGRRGRRDSIAEQVAAAKREDGWQNLISGHGVDGYSKSNSTTFRCDWIDNQQAAELWRGNDLAATIIEEPPGDMFREGFCATLGEGEDDTAKALADRISDLELTSKFTEAVQFERAYGGAALFPVINDSMTGLEQPLKIDQIPEVRAVHVFEPCELNPRTFYTDLSHKKFRKPETYDLVPLVSGGSLQGITTIHESRLIIFPGIQVTNRQVAQANYGWGDSVLTRVWRVLSQFGISFEGMAELLAEWGYGIASLDGLAQALGTDREGAIKKRLAGMMLGKSTLRTLLLDIKDKFERHQVPVSGLSDLLEKLMTRLAAAARMPVTKLFGVSPAGLNATGASDTRAWYDQVAAEQKDVTPQVRQMLRLLLLEKGGATKGKEPDGWDVEWKPLWQPTGAEVAAERKAVADTDIAYVNAGVLSPLQVIKARWGTGRYSPEMMIDPKDIKEMEKAEEEAAEAAAEAASRITQTPPGGVPPNGTPPGAGQPPAGEGPEDEPSFSKGQAPGGAKPPGRQTRGDEYNPDQPRDEQGRWGEGGFGGGSGGKGGGGGREKGGDGRTRGTVNKTPEERAARPHAQQNMFGRGSGIQSAEEKAAERAKAAPQRDPEKEKISGPFIDPDSRFYGKPDTMTQHYKEGKWSAERQALHEEYAQKVLAGVPKSETPTVYMTGGGPAAGKSTGIIHNPEAGIPTPDRAAHVDPDSAKHGLPEFREGKALGDRGAAAHVYEESSHVTKEVVTRALKGGHDVVYDSVGDSGIDKLERKVADMRAAGAQRVVASYATLDVDEALRRAETRARDPKSESFGRFVPTEAIRAAHEDVARTSLAAIERGTFDEMKVFDTSSRTPKLIAEYRKGSGLVVHDKEGWRAHVARARPKEKPQVQGSLFAAGRHGLPSAESRAREKAGK